MNLIERLTNNISIMFSDCSPLRDNIPSNLFNNLVWIEPNYSYDSKEEEYELN